MAQKIEDKKLVVYYSVFRVRLHIATAYFEHRRANEKLGYQGGNQYSPKRKKRAVRLYIESGRKATIVINARGYPSRNILR